MAGIIGTYAAVGAGPGINVKDKIKPDDTGYYRFVLGAFNVLNSRKELYPLTDKVRALFNKGGIIRRRLDKGECRGEYGHPKVNGMSETAALNRVATIDEKSICHHIRSIDLLDHQDENRRPIVLAVGWVKPCGPYGDSLQKSIDNPHESVSFSVRSMVDRIDEGGRIVKIIKDAITYDYVHEPGIAQANKFYTAAALEEYEDYLLNEVFEMDFSEQHLDAAIKLSNTDGFESIGSTLRMVKTAYGWQEIEVTELVSPLSIFNW